MKKLVSLVAIFILVMSLTGCSQQQPSTQSNASDDILVCDQTVTLGRMSAQVPSSWEVTEPSDNTQYIYPDAGGLVMLQVTYDDEALSYTSSTSDSTLDALFSSYIDGVNSSEGFSVADNYSIETDGDTAFIVLESTYENCEGYTYVGVNHGIFGAMALVPSDAGEIYLNTCKYIIGDIKIAAAESSEEKSEDDADGATNDEAASEDDEEEPEEPEMTISQANALAKAQDYLAFSAFSRKGLIAQLKYEKFSSKDAKFAVDHCGANWKEQALKKAKDYLEYSAFSYKGLIKQLKYEKFTSAQAKYAAKHCGANWKKQAAKKAEEYMEFSSFSRDGLISQLKYEGFTDEQARYGVKSVGL